jgi:hypothetical protein
MQPTVLRNCTTEASSGKAVSPVQLSRLRYTGIAGESTPGLYRMIYNLDSCCSSDDTCAAVNCQLNEEANGKERLCEKDCEFALWQAHDF